MTSASISRIARALHAGWRATVSARRDDVRDRVGEYAWLNQIIAVGVSIRCRSECRIASFKYSDRRRAFGLLRTRARFRPLLPLPSTRTSREFEVGAKRAPVGPCG